MIKMLRKLEGECEMSAEEILHGLLCQGRRMGCATVLEKYYGHLGMKNEEGELFFPVDAIPGMHKRSSEKVEEDVERMRYEHPESGFLN